MLRFLIAGKMRCYPWIMNLTFRERLAEKRARVQQIAKEAAALDKIVESDTQSKINIEGSLYDPYCVWSIERGKKKLYIFFRNSKEER